jgi:hypothetical protein
VATNVTRLIFKRDHWTLHRARLVEWMVEDREAAVVLYYLEGYFYLKSL